MTLPNDLDAILDTAVAAARAAGEILLTHAGRTLNVDEAMAFDIKLEVDRLCEEAIVSIVQGRFPDHAILAEEGGAQDGTAAYRWIIDPLDGTVNYFYGIPYYCTSIACYEQPTGNPPQETFESLGRPVAAVVFAPATDELFSAHAEGPCLLNGRPIRRGFTSAT